MTTKERRITALELATGSPIDTEDLALQEMSDDDLEQRARAIVARFDGVKDVPADVQKAKKLLENVDRRREWERAQWGHLPKVNP